MFISLDIVDKLLSTQFIKEMSTKEKSKENIQRRYLGALAGENVYACARAC